MKRIFVVTGDPVVYNGKVSFSFMVKENVPFPKFKEYAKKFAWLRLRKKGDNELNPFKLVRGEPNAVGDDGVKKWEIFVFETGRGQIMTASAEETPKKDIEEGLKDILMDVPECVMLMSKDLYDRFEKACSKIPDINLDHYHNDNEIETS